MIFGQNTSNMHNESSKSVKFHRNIY